MRSHLGHFHGHAKLSMCSRGQATHTISLATNIQVEDAHRHDLIHDLTKWAIKEHVRKCGGVLTSSMPSAVPQSGSHAIEVSEFPLEWAEQDSQVDVDHAEYNCNALESQVSPYRAASSALSDSCNPVDSWLCSGTSSERTTLESLSDFEPSSPWKSGIVSAAPKDYAFSLGDPKVELYVDVGNLLGPSLDADTRGDCDHGTGLPDALDLTAASPSAPFGAIVDDIEMSNYYLRVDEQDLTEDIVGLKRPPAPAVEGGTLSSTDLESEQLANECREQKASAWKKQLKMERNRASARRSNMRKKEANDARKRERKRLQDLEVQLKRIEQNLRSENLMLRKLLVE